MLDEVPVEARQAYRESLEHELPAPLTPAEREEYEEQEWGLRPAQVREAERSEEMLAQWERLPQAAEGV